jgi:hypothetical protein
VLKITASLVFALTMISSAAYAADSAQDSIHIDYHHITGDAVIAANDTATTTMDAASPSDSPPLPMMISIGAVSQSRGNYAASIKYGEISITPTLGYVLAMMIM